MPDTKDELEQLAKEWMSESGGLLEVCDIGDGRTEDELTYHARIAASFALQTNADLIQERDRLREALERAEQVVDELNAGLPFHARSRATAYRMSYPKENKDLKL